MTDGFADDMLTAMELTDSQVAMLQKIGDGRRGPSGLVEFVCATRNEFSTVKALARRGLVQWRYIASRLFGAELTEAGHTVLFPGCSCPECPVCKEAGCSPTSSCRAGS